MIAGLSYDAEIEYLESTGTQHIYTGYYPTAAIGYDAKFRLANGAWIFRAGETFNVDVIGVYGGSTGVDVFAHFPGLNLKFLSLVGVDVEAVLSNHVLTVNGRSTTISFSYPYSNEMKLFRDRSSRLYHARFYEAGVLVRDYIPVRVGNVGYLYDRVTKKLFGNQGTGNFVLGPDVATPVMGLRGMKKFYGACDYIQDGLVALFDGIENAGWGIHNSSATQWNSLVDGEAPLVPFKTSTLKWYSDAAYNFEAYIGNSAVSRNYTSQGFTYEITTRNGWKSFVPTVSDGRLFGVAAFQSNNYYRVRTFGQDGATTSKSGIYNQSSKQNITISINASGQGSIYFNGVVFASATTSATPLKLFGSAFLRLGTGVSNSFNKPLNRVAIYNRALSADEIAHNYNIDKARFNLP